MAILDATLDFTGSTADSLASTTSASNTASTNVLDLTGGNAAEDEFFRLTQSSSQTIADMFRGGTVYFNAQINTVLVSSASILLYADLFVHSAATSLHSGNRLMRLEFPEDAAAGTFRSASIPNIEFNVSERYMGVVYNASGSKVTTGAIRTWLSNYPGPTQITGTQLT